MRKPHKYKVYDFGHKFVVRTLLLTFVGLVSKIGYDVYYWRRYQLPARKEEHKRMLEEQIAQKQAEQAEEMAKQEELQDQVKKIQ